MGRVTEEDACKQLEWVGKWKYDKKQQFHENNNNNREKSMEHHDRHHFNRPATFAKLKNSTKSKNK